MASNGSLPTIRLGGRMFFRKSALDAAFTAMPPVPRPAVKSLPSIKVAQPLGCTLRRFQEAASRHFEFGDAPLAFSGRIKNLIRLNALDSATVRGRALLLSDIEVLRLLVALELCNIGIPPSKALQLCAEHWEALIVADDLAKIWAGPREGTAIQIDMAGLRSIASALSHTTSLAAPDGQSPAAVEVGAGGKVKAS